MTIHRDDLGTFDPEGSENWVPLDPADAVYVTVNMKVLVDRSVFANKERRTMDAMVRYLVKEAYDLRVGLIGSHTEVSVCDARGHVVPADELGYIEPDPENYYPGGEDCPDCRDEAVAYAERQAEGG